MLEPRTGEVRAVDDTFDKPKGLAFSPTGDVLYVTDGGAIQAPGGLDPARPHHVVALDVDPAGLVTGWQVLADIDPGFPDGSSPTWPAGSTSRPSPACRSSRRTAGGFGRLGGRAGHERSVTGMA